MPLFFALLIAAVLGALVGWLLPRFRRSRKVSKDEG
jgi:membrane protein YqaA with SNARE-associated domain